MAEQDATAVAITGGTINNTTIGATTATTGRFTSVTTPSVTASSGNLTLTPVASNQIYLNQSAGGAFGAVLGQDVSTPQNSARLFFDSNVNVASIRNNAGSGLAISTGATIGSTSGAIQFQVSPTTSAVNYVQVTGAATGGSPTITTQGSDTDVRLTFKSKGNAGITFQNSSNNTLFDIPNAFPAVNYFQPNASVTTQATVLKSLGTDTNISMAFQPKGTGAIDLAAGSSGVNISNGGTVTAITRTAGGSGYTGLITAAISAPTTAGGVQATVAIGTGAITQAIAGGGTGYTVGNILTVSGGTFINSAQQQIRVDTVSSGVITGISVSSFGQYTTLPTNPVAVTGGSGSGATFNLSNFSFVGSSITNAGSGYIEQPTITFSGGGGSGAAAYATVGSGTTVKSLGSTMLLQTPGGTAFGVTDIANSVNYIRNQGSATGFQVFSTVQGTDTNTSYALTSKGNGAVSLYTNLGNQLQFSATHTASAVNYVQVTGAATGGLPAISAQGSDTDVSLRYNSKGAGGHIFYNGGGVAQFRVGAVTSAANFLRANAAIATASPALVSEGTDTDIDLTLTPKGTGNVRFGTYTAGVLTPTGYVTIKDSGGTTRRLLVG
jgi:hypothetical protein